MNKACRKLQGKGTIYEKGSHVWSGEYCELPADKDGFKGVLPQIKHMLPFSPFTFYIQRKLFIHNMGHALTAYLGKLKGYHYIWEAISDPYIKFTVLKAM